MKKMFLLFVCMGAWAAHAQDFSWGLKTGLNIAGLSGSNGSVRAGVYAGGFAEWRLSDKIGISPEIYYSLQGSGKISYSGYTSYSAGIYSHTPDYARTTTLHLM